MMVLEMGAMRFGLTVVGEYAWVLCGVVLGLGAALLKCFGQVRAEGVCSWAFLLLLVRGKS